MRETTLTPGGAACSRWDPRSRPETARWLRGCYAALTLQAFMAGDGVRKELVSRALARRVSRRR